MTPDPRRRISDELSPYVDAGEAERIDALADRLDAERPVPRAGFRAELRSRFRKPATERPAVAFGGRRLAAAVGAYVGSGIVLLAVAASGLTGAGPFAP